MLNQPLYHIVELMQSLHCLSYVEVNCPSGRKKTSLDVPVTRHSCESNLGNTQLQ